VNPLPSPNQGGASTRGGRFVLPPPPAGLSDATAPAWFDIVADRLLNRLRLHVAGRPHRLTEVEAYVHAPDHPDPFPHRHPIQSTPGRWYFHRTHGAYRGGSFKGVDVSVGRGPACGGFLLRGLVTPDGTAIDGPSLLVDYLLSGTGFGTVAKLDAALGETPAWDADSPLSLRPAAAEPRLVLSGLRVGLSLKRQGREAVGYLFRRYRYLTDPRQTKKGKPQMVLPLLADGVSVEEVNVLTGCPPAAVKRYAVAFATGRNAEPHFGPDLNTTDLCRLYGWWCERGILT
jgi:hypothetical protein